MKLNTIGLVGLSLIVVAGCTQEQRANIHPRDHNIYLKAEASAPATVTLSQPTATIDDRDLDDHEVTVAGSAQRMMAGSEAIAGFIHIELLDKDNNVIQTAMASLTPETLSADSPSEYKLCIWTPHPLETHVRAVFIDQRDIGEYFTGSGDDAGGSASGRSGGFSGNYTRGAAGGAAPGGYGHGVSGIGGTGGIGGVGGISAFGGRD